MPPVSQPAGPLRLGVNIDHVATLRNARGGSHPDPVRAMRVVEAAGADGVTVHLREDRRHIIDSDVERLMAELPLPLNFEMAATQEMREIALRLRPNAVCIVPERREERTTEGGLEVVAEHNRLGDFITPLREDGRRISLFIEADPRQIDASARVNADIVELHTGRFCEAVAGGREADADKELKRLSEGAQLAHELGLEVHAGHGLDFDSVGPVAALPQVVELNIGHFLVGEALFMGLEGAIREMRARMDTARRAAFNENVPE
ncbi:MAG: pyridoxine 5'-phosphate synthase [Rhodobacteraceae bacterium]|nr:pyridoxine 5'-phosphate synthase [Paracoccaceae bacterium]